MLGSSGSKDIPVVFRIEERYTLNRLQTIGLLNLPSKFNMIFFFILYLWVRFFLFMKNVCIGCTWDKCRFTHIFCNSQIIAKFYVERHFWFSHSVPGNRYPKNKDDLVSLRVRYQWFTLMNMLHLCTLIVSYMWRTLNLCSWLWHKSKSILLTFSYKKNFKCVSCYWTWINLIVSG